jgi:hypothetical protein
MGCASHFVNLLKSEEAREQIVLIIDGPLAGKAKPFPQPEHRFESADLRHVLLHSEMVALDTLLEMLGNIVNRIRMQVPVID